LTTSAAIEAAWVTSIWNNATILAITNQAHPFEINDQSEYELSLLAYGSRINFFEYLVTRATQYPIITGGSGTNQIFTVDVRYTLEHQADGSSYTDVRDTLETLIDLVNTDLSYTWGGTIDFYKTQEGPPQITQTAILERKVIRGQYSFTAQKQI